MRKTSLIAATFVCALARAGDSAPRIPSRAAFDAFARVYGMGEGKARYQDIPHVMVMLDRTSGGKLYYIDSKRWRLHQEFANAHYLSLEKGGQFLAHNYQREDRRFLLGVVAWQPKLKGFTFELWEGDLASPALIQEALAAVRASFFAPVAFKPNSLRQEQAAQTLGDAQVVYTRDLYAAEDYIALNAARRIGVLRFPADADAALAAKPEDILVLKEPALALPPVSGVITTAFSSPLSHINLLAKGWGVPNAFVRDAATRFKALDGQVVVFETRARDFDLRAATPQEVEAFRRQGARAQDLRAPVNDLDWLSLADLKDMRRGDHVRFGSKAANLGEIQHALDSGAVRDAVVPQGFGVPFAHCQRFYEANGFLPEIRALLAEPRFKADAAYRRERLAAVRARIQAGRLNPSFEQALWAKAQAMFGDKGFFVRSSTNSEDLPNFSGAGLYTTVPNVKGEGALGEAIKTVWASLWNYEAYEAREAAGIDHFQVWAAVLVQEGVNGTSAGVLITQNPFNPDDHVGVYINAKKGLGIRVVEGKPMAEQILFRPRSNSVQVLTRSADDTMLRFDAKGGVKEVPIEAGRAVLTDELARRLSSVALQVKKVFGGKDQDMEWVCVGDHIFLVQSRPYIDRHG
jgi:hypothetical protein